MIEIIEIIIIGIIIGFIGWLFSFRMPRICSGWFFGLCFWASVFMIIGFLIGIGFKVASNL